MLKELLYNPIINIDGSLFYCIAIPRYYACEGHWCEQLAEFLGRARNIQIDELNYCQQLNIRYIKDSICKTRYDRSSCCLPFCQKKPKYRVYACYNPLILILTQRSLIPKYSKTSYINILIPVNMTRDQFTIFLCSYLSSQKVATLDLGFYYNADVPTAEIDNYNKYLELYEEIDLDLDPWPTHCALYRPNRKLNGMSIIICLCSPFIESDWKTLVKFDKKMTDISRTEFDFCERHYIQTHLLGEQYEIVVYNKDGNVEKDYCLIPTKQRDKASRKKIEILWHADGEHYLIKRLDDQLNNKRRSR